MLYTEFKTSLYIVWIYPLVEQIQQGTTVHYQLQGIASAYAYPCITRGVAASDSYSMLMRPNEGEVGVQAVSARVIWLCACLND